jgi:hypothetical protein
MTTRSLPYLTVLAVFLIALTGCAPERVDTTENDVVIDQAEIDGFQSEMRSRLDEIDGDIARVEERGGALEEDDAQDARNRAEDLREEARDIEQRLEMPEASNANQWRDWRQSIHSDVTSLEARVDGALINTSTDIAGVQSIANERLSAIRSRIEEVPDADDRRDLQEEAQEVEQEISEAVQAPEDDLESVRSDVASSVESLRNSLANTRMYVAPERVDDQQLATDRDDEWADDRTDDEDADAN